MFNEVEQRMNRRYDRQLSYKKKKKKEKKDGKRKKIVSCYQFSLLIKLCKVK